MNELRSKETITSKELLEQVNFFREKEYEFKAKNGTLTEAEKKRGAYVELRHDILLGIIKDEFEEEISLQKILESKYKNDRGREYPMFVLTIPQAKQVLVRESKFVRKHMIAYLEQLEEAVRNSKNNLSEKDKYLLDIFRSKDEVENLFKFDRGYVRPLEDKLEAAEKEVEHKK